MHLENNQVFLSLVRQGIGHGLSYNNYYSVDWAAIKALADEHGLSAIVLDGIEKLDNNLTNGLSIQNKLEWIGEVLQNYEGRYAAYKKAIGELAGFYNQHGFKMMLLKGYACSLNWPKPEHRPCGDIDIWQYGQQKEADSILSKEKRIKIDNTHHHHTVFYWKDFMVENHYDFVNVHHSRSNAKIEKDLKRLGNDDSHYVVISGEKVYMPSPNLHALFLLRHAMIEFAASGLNLRQLLDWALFVKAHSKEVDWEWLESLMEEYGMKRLYDVFNAICVGDLGFPVDIFTKVQFDPILKERVLNEILSPSVSNIKPQNFFSRVLWKWHRWKSNEWKHRLVYKESMWSTFWSGVWSHMLKPMSI